MAVCSGCREEIPDEARFCPLCGAAREAGERPSVPRSEVAPPTIADPFSHTAPADPEELARVRAMIEAKQQESNVSVRERQFGSTKALSAEEDRRTEPPAGAPARERTMASPVMRSNIPPPPQRPVEIKQAPEAPRPSPVSPRAATTAHAQTPMVGAPVRILWSDGQAYPAMVMEVTPTHCSVRFTNGHTQWVEHRLVLPG